MREWLTPTILILCFIFVVALAGPTVDELSLFADRDAAAIFRSDSGITLEQLAQARGLPTTPKIWNECCSHRDCHEAEIQVRWMSEDWARIRINGGAELSIEGAKVFNSLNGKSYYCRISPFHWLTGENIKCVFITGGRLV